MGNKSSASTRSRGRAPGTSLRAAINAKCRECTYDPADKGSAAQQIACCTSDDCPLHPVRPVTAKTIPLALLAHWGITADKLGDRVSVIIENELSSSDGQFGALADTESVSEQGAAA
jgi:hypothetical protein